MMNTTSQIEEKAKMIIKNENMELQYNIVIDETSNQKTNNVSAADMNYITIRKENLCTLISRLKGDYFYESTINIISYESVDSIVDYFNENLDIVKNTIDTLKLEIGLYQINW